MGSCDASCLPSTGMVFKNFLLGYLLASYFFFSFLLLLLLLSRFFGGAALMLGPSAQRTACRSVLGGV